MFVIATGCLEHIAIQFSTGVRGSTVLHDVIPVTDLYDLRSSNSAEYIQLRGDNRTYPVFIVSLHIVHECSYRMSWCSCAQLRGLQRTRRFWRATRSGRRLTCKTPLSTSWGQIAFVRGRSRTTVANTSSIWKFIQGQHWKLRQNNRRCGLQRTTESSVGSKQSVTSDEPKP